MPGLGLQAWHDLAPTHSPFSSCPSFSLAFNSKHTNFSPVPQRPTLILYSFSSLCLDVSLPRSLHGWFLLIFQVSAQMSSHSLSWPPHQKIVPYPFLSFSHHLVGFSPSYKCVDTTSMMIRNYILWFATCCRHQCHAALPSGMLFTSPCVSCFSALTSIWN